MDREKIKQAVLAMAPVVAALTKHDFAESEITHVVRLLETVYAVGQGEAVSLVDSNNTPTEWYVGERRKPGPFMSRYIQKLSEDGWPRRSVDELRDSTARVVELIEDPKRDGPWSWKGLVVGDVQSGKTAHYAGVINRSIDAGYRLIVVLAGMHNVLRLQTQQRLESDVLGYDTSPDNRTSAGPPLVGVGKIPPRLSVGSMTFAANNGDFSLAFTRQANFAPLSQPCVFVVKKNAAILENLNNWIRGLPEEVRDAPFLLIDDEADQASIDTKDQPTLSDGTFVEDYDPTRVNGAIRKLLGAFKRSAYVAYTATPFANILIHDERSAANYGFDLFPSTFILSLSAPDDYFGPVAVFGTTDGANAGLDLVRHVPQGEENWIPDTHDKTLVPQWDGCDEVPPSLKQAIDDFVIACAVRAARGQKTAHNSMLVHVSRFVDVHEHVHRQVETYLDEVKARISANDDEVMDGLHARWTNDFETTRCRLEGSVFGRGLIPVTWHDVRSVLADSTDKIRVITANGKAKTGLDYDRYRDSGLSVIAVGGDKLSRGLTLEGLTTSYFLRVSKQYDSLLQMGRWFGYRRGYADVCRLHTTFDMERWLRHVATASADLRSQIVHMKLLLKTPKDYGLKIQAHSIMTVTAPSKQRYAKERRTSYSGEGKIQTVMFKDKAILDSNALALESMLQGLGEPIRNPKRPFGRGVAKGLLWSTDGQTIVRFLRNLQLPPEGIDLDSSRLAGYIEQQLSQSRPELVSWSVFLAEGRGQVLRVGQWDIECIQRAPLRRSSDSRFIVKSILNPPDEAIDLTDEEFERALAMTNREQEEKKEPPKVDPSGPSVRAARSADRGLLLVYPMDPKAAGAPEGADRPVLGVVVSFPDSPTAVQAFQIENRILQKERLT
ncbi:Z1 domain-containing protein [Lysobacter humi (ex Lee et al. 2017)]